MSAHAVVQIRPGIAAALHEHGVLLAMAAGSIPGSS